MRRVAWAATVTGVAEYFNVERMHFLAIDSFTPRGLKSICETRQNLRTIDQEGRRDDVFAAIRWLAQRPDVDRNRIAVVGYSNGGSTVLYVVDRTKRRCARSRSSRAPQSRFTRDASRISRCGATRSRRRFSS